MKLSLSLLLACLTPYLVYTQTDISSSRLENNGKIRLGFSVLRDFAAANPYEWSANEIASRLHRKLGLGVEVDRQILGYKSNLRLQFGIGFNYTKKLSYATELDAFVDGSLAPFEETYRLDFTQFTLGLSYEPFQQQTVSPYFSGGLLLSVPSHLHYNYQAIGVPRPNHPYQVEIEGGVGSALGWIIQGGMQFKVSRNCRLAFGFHYLEVDHEANWPRESIPYYGDRTILRINNVGMHVKWVYVW